MTVLRQRGGGLLHAGAGGKETLIPPLERHSQNVLFMGRRSDCVTGHRTRGWNLRL